MAKPPEFSPLRAPAFGLMDASGSVFETVAVSRRRFAHFHHQEISENDQALEALKDYGIRRFFHNAGNEDQFPGRYEEGLANPGIPNLELDVTPYKGKLMVAHTVGGLERYIHENPKAATEQLFENVLARSVEAGKNVNLDIKFNSSGAAEEFNRIVSKVPETTEVFLSGRNWRHMFDISRSIKRPIIPLYTLDGIFGDGWNRYMDEILRHHPTYLHGQVGVSINSAVATPRVLEELKECGAFSLVFYVDTPQDAIRFANLGASGITTNNKDIILATKQKPPQSELVIARK